MNNTEDRIRQFFDKHPRESFKSRQVAHRLNIESEKEFQLLRDALHAMVEQRVLSYVRREGYHRQAPSRGLVGTIAIGKRGAAVVLMAEENLGSVQIAPKYLGTALDGDTVEVALFALPKKKNHLSDQQEGEVVRIVKRGHTEFVGNLQQSKSFFFVVCDNATMSRDIYVPQEALNGARPGDKVVVSLEEWKSDLQNPEGRILEVLGRTGNARIEVTAVMKAHRLPLHFPKEVEEAARAIPDSIPEALLAGRLDLRKETCFTIDPEDAKDFDDAISLDVVDSDTVRLGVHIADVSAYVREGSVIDKEARLRGTSVYLANQVVPMLPEKLSNNLCSLMPKTDRLAFSCIMDLTLKGIVKDYRIVHSIIRSKRRFSYEEVEKVLDGKPGDHADILHRIWDLASVLRKARIAKGSVDFNSPEAKFHYDASGLPDEIIVKKQLKSHQLVEECMLLANQTVAKHIGKKKERQSLHPFVYRIHGDPNREKLEELAAFAKNFGHTLNVSASVTSKVLQKLLRDVEGTPEQNVITEVALRSMAKAVYSVDNIGHFGLAFDHYTHFTSPIRRYPDLIVHRLLDEYEKGMSLQRVKFLTGELPKICLQSSERERVAMNAERESVCVMQAEYMKRHLGDEFDGMVSGVASFGLFIEINDLLVEGMLHVRSLGDDYYMHDDRRYSLVGQRSGRVFRLGDPIRVKVIRVNPERREIDFEFVDTEPRTRSKKKKKR
jgi:ribonuclease R